MKKVSIVLSLYVLCVPTVVANTLVHQNTIGNDSESISLPSFLNSQHVPSSYLVRSLQQDDFTWTDERICEAILDQTYLSDYEESMAPCTCERTTDSSGTTPGTFFVNCNHEYCDKCLNSNELCGYRTANFTIMENLDAPFLIVPKESYSCLKYSAGRDDDICMKIEFDELNGEETTCQIQIGDQVCTSCEYVACGDDDLVDDKITAMSFDCSNNAELYAINMCDYVTPTESVIPVSNAIDPFGYLHFDSNDWETCYNSSDDNVSTNGTPAESNSTSSSPTDSNATAGSPADSNSTSDKSSSLIIGSTRNLAVLVTMTLSLAFV
jgi:hypothetical protein